MNKTFVEGHSIWLRPDPQEGRRIAESIARLSEAFNSHIFSPHLTLLGQIPGDIDYLVPRFRRLASESNRLSVVLESIGMHDQFYQALFYKAGRSVELVGMNQYARELFQHRSDAEYFPHISLLYSAASARDKEEVLSRLQIQKFGEISLTHMTLMQTQGELEDWKSIEEIELK